MTGTAAMERTSGNETNDPKSENDTKSKDHHAPGPDDAHKTPSKKRRKVNHACLYCRRSHMTCDLERPCTRCVKRNIGHLCHDEPRDQDSRKSKSVAAPSTVHESESQPDLARSTMDQGAGSMGPPSFDASGMSTGPGQVAKAAFDATALSRSNALQLVQPTPVSGIQPSALSSNMNQFTGFSDHWLNTQNHYHDMHNLHPNYMFAPEVTNEFNLLHDFLQNSLLDDGEQAQQQLLGTSPPDAVPGFPGNDGLLPPSATQGGGSMPLPNVEQGKSIARPSSAIPTDKAREYYLQAADPSGNDTPEERMQRVLKAKYDAGLLKPFSYIEGYKRLSSYLDTHVAPASKLKILRQLDRFRPKFREKMQALTDMDLVLVEMWFEKTLMEYDRVFASMAVPACCWRRTGEIFRGNKEMAELINVPVERLRGGKIALHEILTEDSNVRYWEEFGTIAFDPAHDTLLTACSLKNPDDSSSDPIVNCCFSFRIRRDDHKMWSAVNKAEKRIDAAVGMFMPCHPPFHYHRHLTAHYTHSRNVMLEFARDLHKILSSGSPKDLPATDDLATQIRTHIDRLFHSNGHGVAHAHAQRYSYVHGVSGSPEIDELGTRLWNLCTRLRRREDPTMGQQRLKKQFLYGRVLALNLLVVAKPLETSGGGELVRILKLSLKTARDCLVVDGDTVLAGAVLGTAGEYKSRLQDFGEEGLTEREKGERRCLEVEYFIIRTVLAWIEKRLDVAEHMYTKAERLHKFLTPIYAERLADVLFEIGKSMCARGDYKIAAKWLDRANEVINTQSLEQLSREGVELRLAIMQALFTALLGQETPEGLERANNMVDFIESEVGSTRMVVSLLRLELLQKTPAEVFDADVYSEVLRRMIRNFGDGTDAAFKLIVHHVRKLHDKSPSAGCAVLDDFILALRNITAEGNSDSGSWIEKVVITRMWMITNQRDSVETIEVVRGLLSHLTRPLSAEAAVAAQALTWKKLESCYSLNQFDLAEKWCLLSLHSVFHNCGTSNTAKLERKLLLCALARNNLDAAVSIIQGMTKQNWKTEPITAYLAFKVAIRVQDHELAERCLDAVSLAPDHVDFLGACIAESQKAEDISCAIAALKKLQSKYEHKEPNPIHLPALLRCTIRLLNLLVERQDNAAEKEGIVNDLCSHFETVLYSTMQKIVNEIWVLETFDVVKLSQYTRCLFHTTLPLDDALAMNLLDESCKMARELREKDSAGWPEEELEWMATTSFNHAVDCYSVQEGERAREWATKAINLAHYCNDEGFLEDMLQRKFSSLKFDSREEERMEM
ncbi:meiosis protein SPO22/ZIP4 like-domain-containing protein [Apodospora peruviana]|uniref:Meiosis protein SPO22/ZIP4 like-domain-containing protein n=1 Tax=Apodospora peruviana TaxID=516989 RepID=A0AAE0HXE8_9PEZI|nr:meiosis protein SPO22/ZIP4 like-domain-containing protein [Apodospora peruviana]